jgi:hypothetical protein
MTIVTQKRAGQANCRKAPNAKGSGVFQSLSFSRVGRLRSVVESPLVDPKGDRADRRIGKGCSTEGHLRSRGGSEELADEKTSRSIARNDRWTTVPASDECLIGRQREASASAMARGAAVDLERRADKSRE